jgi:hypothetical protein
MEQSKLVTETMGDELYQYYSLGSYVVRAHWEEQFQQMTSQGDDQLLDSNLLTTTWDEEEWEWWSSESRPGCRAMP